MSTIIAVDTGGTFTDLVAYDTATGQMTFTKSLTTYGDLVDGVCNAIAKAKTDLHHASSMKFGTTLVINTFVQRNGALTALVTTKGFKDVLDVRRGNRPFPFDLHYYRDPVLVEREHRLELTERVAGDGSIVTDIDEDELSEIAGELKKIGAEAVAVSFINAYKNPGHEERVAAALRHQLPGTYITSGTELAREWYEYERTSTAVANAYVGPRLQDYVGRLKRKLHAEGLAKPFFLMASNGGVFSTELAERQPVMLLESGPVGGCIGACEYAKALSIPRLIAFDMGGTTAKCAVVEEGAFESRSPYYVGGYHYGFPILGAVVDIVEVGAGGGSIARVDERGRLSVGPMSAGSEPGPAAYGRGGVEATVTDANLVLGRIGAESFLGGEMKLDADLAIKAIRERVAGPLGFTGEAAEDEAANGILALGIATMASAIRQVTIERGLDPREFSLFAYGGGGPLHAGDLARELNIPEVIIPLEPGNFSAVGMLVSDARVDEAATFLRSLDEGNLPEMASLFASLEASVKRKLADGNDASRINMQRMAEIRYRGQKQGLKFAIGDSWTADEIRQRFEAVYARRYGHCDPSAPLELVSLAVVALAPMQRPDLAGLTTGARKSRGGDRKPGTRSVFFAHLGRRAEAAVFQRRDLAPGFSHSGPAVIEEYGSTTVIGPGDTFRIGTLSEIRVTIGNEGRTS